MSGHRGSTCYIHVGPHKTGSSSIKHFMRGNREAIDALGLFFPMLIGTNGKPARNHEELAKVREIGPNGDLRPNAKLWPEIDAVAAKGEKDILLSSEMFCGSLDDEVRFGRILDYFGKRGYRVKILAYVRDQPAWLNSWYVQSQKRFAGLMTFDQFAENGIQSGRVSPRAYLKKFVDQPRCELEVISFERAIATSLEYDFIRRCGVAEGVRFEKTPLRNSNAGAKSVYAAQEIMRRAGPGLKNLSGYGPVYNRFKRRCRELGFDDTPYVALDQARYDRIRAHFAAANESFAQEYFGTSWTALCPPRTYAVSIFDPAKAKTAEVEQIEKLVANVVAKLAELREDDDRPRARREREAALVD